MQRRIEANRRTSLWIERIVWNAAAGAVLAVMILVLLGSLEWLDRVAPREATALGPVSSAPVTGPQANASGSTVRETAAPAAEVARVGRPAG